ncbi:MAG TPA: LutB/LldF family L-lactate oxidation iron-sulfur protein [Candidatus Acidoferrum sp.]|nr:LutB/LldF family L-lactate oxidation iron-sulfur protein [Candidatus Acidoferrum sp.]
MTTAAQEFLRAAAHESTDLTRRKAIRHAIDQYDAAVQRGRKQFVDYEAARQKCYEIKWEALNHLDKYLLEFEEKVKARGGQVFWAETAEDARRYIADLAMRRGVRTVVKSKSMVTEEIHLTPALEKLGLRVFETDLGEFIVQLRNEPPFHIVTPAMHLTRGDIAKLFREKLPNAMSSGASSEDPPELVAVARRALRRAFFSAEMGITGANFLVADAGMIAITTNEGNDRLGTALPRLHVAVVGIEKVIPRLEDLAILWPVLATAGTGQTITCYDSLIGGPRRDGEVDGPEEFHVVLLDNGRTDLLADAEQRDVLHCIRCGSCLNACPVFRAVGGHTYGTTYSGPIGSVLTPHLRGLNEFQHLSYASSLCGACTSVCPVKIDLHHHLLHNRRNAVREGDRPWHERAAFKLWRWTMNSAGRFALAGAAGRAALRGLYRLGLEATAVDPLRPWTKYRTAPPIPRKSFRAMWRENGTR